MCKNEIKQAGNETTGHLRTRRAKGKQNEEKQRVIAGCRWGDQACDQRERANLWPMITRRKKESIWGREQMMKKEKVASGAVKPAALKKR